MYRLKINLIQTKVMAVSHVSVQVELMLQGTKTQVSRQIEYLGAIMDDTGDGWK